MAFQFQRDSENYIENEALTVLKSDFLISYQANYIAGALQTCTSTSNLRDQFVHKENIQSDFSG